MYLLFDIGGTKTRVAVAKKNETTITKMKIFATPHLFSEGVELIEKTAKELAPKANFSCAAGGLALPLDKKKTKAVFHSEKATFKDWVNKPLKRELEKKLNCPVFLENDTVMGALGEAVFGTGKNKSIVAYLTISTGIGGARIVNKKIDANSLGFEPEWQIIGNSGVEFPKTPKEPLFLGTINGRNIKNMTGENPANITDSKFWNQVAHILAVGVHNTTVYWSPDIIIFGGSVSKKISLQKVQQEFEKFPYPFAKRPKIKKAVLADKCGLYGALHYIKTLDM